MPTAQSVITLSWTVNDVMQRFPRSAPKLNQLGVDTCCGSMNTLAIAAQNAGIQPDDLLAALGSFGSEIDPSAESDALPVVTHCGCSSSTAA